jgi:hypothetical protein
MSIDVVFASCGAPERAAGDGRRATGDGRRRRAARRAAIARGSRGDERISACIGGGRSTQIGAGDSGISRLTTTMCSPTHQEDSYSWVMHVQMQYVRCRPVSVGQGRRKSAECVIVDEDVDSDVRRGAHGHRERSAMHGDVLCSQRSHADCAQRSACSDNSIVCMSQCLSSVLYTFAHRSVHHAARGTVARWVRAL